MNLQSIDLNLLLAFEALMVERNVTRAAARVGLSQPAMSNALARLRRTFDDPLLVRTPTGMSPTPAAEALIGPVRTALSGLRSAIEDDRAFDPGASERTFHILTNDYIETVLLAQMLGIVNRLAPGVTLKTHRPARLFQAPAASAMADSYDMSIGFFPDVVALDTSLRSEVVREENSVCIAADTHPSIRGTLSLKQYATAGHVAVFYKSEGPGFIDALFQQRGLERKTVAFASNFLSVPFIVASSDLIATVPETLARRFSKQLKLQVFALPIAIPVFRWTMLWHEHIQADPAHTWLRRIAAETASHIR